MIRRMLDDDAAGLRWAVREAGPKTNGTLPLVMLHGFTGDGGAWEAVACRLDRRVIAPDLPGHGETTPVVPAGPWSLDRLAAALAHWLPARFDLAGYSLGGRLALHLATACPGRVGRLVVVGASAGLETFEARAARREADEAWARCLERDGLEAFAEAWEAQPLFAGLGALDAATRDAERARRRAQRPEGLAWAMRAFGLGGQAPLHGALAALETPTLWVAGERDLKFAGLARALAGPMPNARWALVPRSGHNVPIEQPEALARLITAFLAESPTPPAPQEATR